ncbi:hypothetical protein NAU58_18320 [Pseudomonas stutzeri]|uniref:Uncharacterized protein n=1 Tax=Stutzerimonas stutzeri TaxID=316 RepID=A0A2N8RZ73_STUST|nr:hypothetical protein [Stutzerimonas stutzeri]MCQ4297536.1 hypothetical protein [Stutzerimonas stutzeri]PNF79671.1 hypothetical protein CXK92_13585 [Stutzerimonas stutzeri]
MNRILTSVAVLLLAGSTGAFAGSSEQKNGDGESSGAAGRSTVESQAPHSGHADKESADHEERTGEERPDSNLGTMGTGNTGTTGGMGATTGTDTIGGTIEE